MLLIRFLEMATSGSHTRKVYALFFPNSRLPLLLLLKIPFDTLSHLGQGATQAVQKHPIFATRQQKTYLGGGEGHPWQGSLCPASRPALAGPVRAQRQHPPEVG